MKLTFAAVGFGLIVGFSSLDIAAQSTVQDSVGTDVVLNSKPRAMYSEVARKKNFQGTVVLNVEFLSNGTIGRIEDATKKNRKKLIKYGLAGAAFDAAKKIRFEPATKNGIPITVFKTVEYHFNIY